MNIRLNLNSESVVSLDDSLLKLRETSEPIDC